MVYTESITEVFRTTSIIHVLNLVFRALNSKVSPAFLKIYSETNLYLSR
jgi:hypothetical protein